MTEDRKVTLLKACYALLKKCNEAGYVQDAMSTTVFYDEADCDGHCLMVDIQTELNVPEVNP